MIDPDASFASALFDEDDLRLDGLRDLLTRAGVEITTADLVTAADVDGDITLDRLGELSLVLGLEPGIVRQSLGDLMLQSALFAFETADGAFWLFMPGVDGMLSCVDLEGSAPDHQPGPDTPGRALVFPEARRSSRGGPTHGTMRTILGWTRKPLAAVIGITFASNVLGLSLPIFTLAVYDQVLASGEPRILAMLVLGLGLGLAGDALLRTLRSKIVSRSAAHLDVRISSRVVGNMLRRIDGALIPSTGAVQNRLREIDRIRSFLFGAIGLSLIEAPFALIYVLVLVLLIGWVAIVPIGFLVLGFTLAGALLGSASRRGRAALARADEYGALCTEIAGRLGAIRAEGSEAVYEDRFRDASARLGEAELLQQRTSQIVQLVSSVLVSLAVLLTLTMGALLAMDGGLSVGALIASIALVWRMSAPLPALLQARLRWPDISGALATTGELLSPDARETSREGGSSSGGRTMAGRVVFSSVTFAYARGQTAALRNLSVEIAPGELIAVTGHNGAGKSTLLDVASGLLEPQFGSVTIDGVNPQQVAPSTLRQSIGYLSRNAAGIPLSIREFLRLGIDPVDRNEVDDICARLGLSGAIAALPDGDHTTMDAIDGDSGLAHGLALARTLATNAPLLLLDEPDAASRSARAGLLAELRRLRGASTVILVTHEPSFIEIADRVLVLNGGALARMCAPRDIARQRQA